jgi:hypothetical protein
MLVAEIVYSAETLVTVTEDAKTRAVIAQGVWGEVEEREDLELGSPEDGQHVLNGAGYAALREGRRDALHGLLPKIAGGILKAIAPGVPWWVRWGFWVVVAVLIVPLLLPAAVWLIVRYRKAARAMIRVLNDAKERGDIDKKRIESGTKGTAAKCMFHRMRDKGELSLDARMGEENGSLRSGG